MKKRDIKSDDTKVVTKGYLRGELKTFKTELKTELKRELRTEFRKEFATKHELRDGFHDLEYRLCNRMDIGFESLRQEMHDLKDMVQGLADKVKSQ